MIDDHLKYIVTKIARQIGIMARSTKLVNQNYKVKVYNSNVNVISFERNANGQTTEVAK